MKDDLDENQEDSWPVRQIPIADELWDEAQKFARLNGQSVQDVIRWSLGQYIYQESGKRHRPM